MIKLAAIATNPSKQSSYNQPPTCIDFVGKTTKRYTIGPSFELGELAYVRRVGCGCDKFGARKFGTCDASSSHVSGFTRKIAPKILLSSVTISESEGRKYLVLRTSLKRLFPVDSDWGCYGTESIAIT